MRRRLYSCTNKTYSLPHNINIHIQKHSTHIMECMIRYELLTQYFKLKTVCIDQRPYPFDLLQCWHWFFNLFQIAPIWIFLLIAPFGILALFQHSTEIHTARIRYIHLHFGRIFAVNIRNDDFIFAFIIWFTFAHAKRDCIGFAIGEEFEASALNDLGNTFVEFKCWRRSTFNLDADVSS